MSNGLVPLRTEIQPRYGWDEIRQLADETAKSGLFKMSAPQILVLMMIAESEGVHPIRALLMYDIIDGKPALKAVTMAAKFQQAGGIVEWHETTTEAASATFTHPSSCPAGIRVRYTIDDAKLAGLTGKDNWRKDPGSMLVARCISRGVRRCLPGVIMGIYEPDEIPEAPTAVEQSSRAKLVDTLKTRRERPLVDVVDAHGEVIEPPTPQELVSEPKPAATPKTEWIAGELDEWNIDREKMAEHHPELGGLAKKVTPMQVVNHLVKVSVGTDQSSLATAGKRDPAKVVAFMAELWTTDQEWIEEETRSYLAEIIAKATTKDPEQQAVSPVS